MAALRGCRRCCRCRQRGWAAARRRQTCTRRQLEPGGRQLLRRQPSCSCEAAAGYAQRLRACDPADAGMGATLSSAAPQQQRLRPDAYLSAFLLGLRATARRGGRPGGVAMHVATACLQQGRAGILLRLRTCKAEQHVLRRTVSGGICSSSMAVRYTRQHLPCCSLDWLSSPQRQGPSLQRIAIQQEHAAVLG